VILRLIEPISSTLIQELVFPLSLFPIYVSLEICIMVKALVTYFCALFLHVTFSCLDNQVCLPLYLKLLSGVLKMLFIFIPHDRSSL
jgi:hypothetical protein